MDLRGLRLSVAPCLFRSEARGNVRQGDQGIRFFGAKLRRGGGDRDALERGEVPPPPPPAQPMPSHCPPDGKCPASMTFVTDSNRPQPLWQPPPTACLTASGAASEAPSLLMHPSGGGGGARAGAWAVERAAGRRRRRLRTRAHAPVRPLLRAAVVMSLFCCVPALDLCRSPSEGPPGPVPPPPPAALSPASAPASAQAPPPPNVKEEPVGGKPLRHHGHNGVPLMPPSLGSLQQATAAGSPPPPPPPVTTESTSTRGRSKGRGNKSSRKFQTCH